MRRTANVRVGELAGYKYVSTPKMFGMNVRIEMVLIFRPGARKTMHEECYTHCIISTRAISTSAISINNAFFMLFTDFS